MTKEKGKRMYEKGQVVPDNIIKHPDTEDLALQKRACAECDLVFVYGTLRHRYGNHTLLGGAKYIGDALTYEKYTMTGGGIPYVCPYEPTCRIVGEVYKVTPLILKRLDRLEGHPQFYYRVIIRTNTGRRAWIYFCNRGTGPVFPTGDFSKPPQSP